MKNIINEGKKTLEIINSRITEAEEWVSVTQKRIKKKE